MGFGFTDSSVKTVYSGYTFTSWNRTAQLTNVNLLQKHSILVQIKGRVNGAIAPGLPASGTKIEFAMQ